MMALTQQKSLTLEACCTMAAYSSSCFCKEEGLPTNSQKQDVPSSFDHTVRSEQVRLLLAVHGIALDSGGSWWIMVDLHGPGSHDHA